MNLPNKLSCLRLILIPVFTALFYLPALPYNYLFALAVFAIASATDFLDGYIARKHNLVTNLGKFLDPIADKVLVSTALIVICAAQGAMIPIVGPVCVAIILARDLIISGFRQVAAKTGFVMAADKVGKIKTVTQDVAMIALMVYLQFPKANFATEWLYYASNAFLILATLLTIVSGINYIVKNAAVLKDNFLTLDLHATQIQGFFDIPCDHLYASPVIYDYLKDQPVENLTVFSPDVGGLKRAQAYATMFDCQLGFIAKRRINAETVEATNLMGDVEGRDILIVDDMTETAGTLTAAAKILKNNGAKSVKAAVTHAQLTDSAFDRLSENWLDELIVTDSIPPQERFKDYPITVLSIAPILTEAILRIHNNLSVTSLFKVKGF